MKIAICNETYRDWSFESAFAHAAEAGYDGIEIAPFTLNEDAFQISQNQIEEVVALAKEHGLEIIGLHWLLAFTQGLNLTSPEEATRIRTADYLIQLAQICRQLGGHVMVLGSPQQRQMASVMTVEQGNQNALDCLSRCLPAFQEHSVTLALEPLGPEEGNFLLTADWGRQLIKRLGSQFVKLHLDVKAMSTEADSIPSIIQASKNELVHFHANDPNRRGPGMGNVDYAPIIAALNEIGYDGWLSVEVFDNAVPPKQTALESIQYLKNVLASHPEAAS